MPVSTVVAYILRVMKLVQATPPFAYANTSVSVPVALDLANL